MDNLTKAIARLIELTQKGGLDWKVTRHSETIIHPILGKLMPGQYYDIRALTVKYEGERLRMFRRSERPVLQVVDESDNTLYEFPHEPALFDLMDAAEYRASRIVAGLIDKLASGD